MTQDLPTGPEPAPALPPAETRPESPVDSVLVGAPVEPAPQPAPASADMKPALAESIVYEPFSLPDGVSVEPDALEQAHALFAESGLPQKQAQRFVDLALAREKAAAERGVKAFHDLQARWVAEIKADPEIGGERLGAAVVAASRVLERLAIPGLREALNVTGAGNHPAIVKAFVRIGRLLAEDRFSPGRDGPAQAHRSPADVIYGGQPLK